MLKTSVDKISFSVVHGHMSTGLQKPLSNSVEVRSLCDLWQQGIGGRDQVLVDLLNDQVDLNSGCQHKQLLFHYWWSWRRPIGCRLTLKKIKIKRIGCRP